MQKRHCGYPRIYLLSKYPPPSATSKSEAISVTLPITLKSVVLGTLKWLIFYDFVKTKQKLGQKLEIWSPLWRKFKPDNSAQMKVPTSPTFPCQLSEQVLRSKIHWFKCQFHKWVLNVVREDSFYHLMVWTGNVPKSIVCKRIGNFQAFQAVTVNYVGFLLSFGFTVE